MIRCVAASLLAMVMVGQLAAADDPSASPFQSQLFSPELILEHRGAIGLTDEQWQRCREHLEQGEASGKEAQQRVQPLSQQLSQLLAADPIDEAAALEQLDRLLEAERDVKRVHLRSLIRLRNELTEPQRRLLASKAAAPGENFRDRLQAKLVRIQRELQRRGEAGHLPEDAVRVMQSFQAKIEGGRPDEAEAVLDQVLRMLGLDGAPSRPAPGGAPRAPDQAAARPATEEPDALARVPAMAAESSAAVRRQFDALESKDVAWRSIPWETCLIDGLKKSRDQRKPVMLWIFIDRPIDDERC